MDNELLEPNNLFSHIKPLRLALGLSSAKVAKAIGKSEAEYLDIENGLNTDCITLIRIADLFCCSADYALSYNWEPVAEHVVSPLLKLHRAFRRLSQEEREKVADYACSLLPKP